MRRAHLYAAVLGLTTATAAVAADTLPRARPLTDRTFERTPERLERGRYLTEHVLQCFICHSDRDTSRPGAPPVEARKGAGTVRYEEADRRLVAPNLTPDPETGAGLWTDDMLARAIREGIGHDGRALSPSMWYGSFSMLSDEDLASVIVYVRSIPAVRNPLPPTVIPAEERERWAYEPRPITTPVPGPPPGDALARGRYLANVADCAGCHTSWHGSRMPGLYGGGNHIETRIGSAFSANLTPDASGVTYAPDAFVAVIRNGKGGSMSPVMPWVAFAGMTDDDLVAISRAFAELQPVRHCVGNIGEAKLCAVCGQSHPHGELNRIETPVGIKVDPAVLARYAGSYRHPAWDLTIAIRAEGSRLYGTEPGAEEIELVPVTATRFAAPGWPAPVEFEVDDSGNAIGLWALELEREHFDRVP